MSEQEEKSSEALPERTEEEEEKEEEAAGGSPQASERQPVVEKEDETAAQDIQDGDGGHQIEKDAAKEKREARLKRLRELHIKRDEARRLNHSELVEEDRRNKLPANWEARRRKAEWEQADDDARKQAEEAGEDYERVKLLETSAADLDRLERKRKRKNPDSGFADFSQAQFRQYDRLTRQMAPDMEEYERMKQEMGEDFYPGVNSLVHGGKGRVSKTALDRMAEDLEKQIDKRSKYSRYRGRDEEADVDYINERNMKFNQKAARFYDQYTSEIKQNLERGTAV